MASAQQRDYDTYLRTGWRRDGGPHSGVALQLKFNPNHDPDDGRFTFAGAGASSGGGGGTVTARRSHAPAGPTRGKAVFGRRANEVGIDGEVADKLNQLVENPHAGIDITLGSLPLTIRRMGADTVTMSGSVLGRLLEMEGHLDVVDGKQAIVISKLQPKAGADSLPMGYRLSSFPKTIRIVRSAATRRMIYSFDEPVIGKSDTFGTYNAHGAGTFYFKH